MARLEDGSDQTLVEVKAVDGAYPLYGALVTEPALPQAELFGERDGVFGAAAPDLMFERLGIATGIAHKARQGDVRTARKTRDRAGRGFRRFRLRAAADGVAGRACRLRPDPARQPGRACLQGEAPRRDKRGRPRRHPRPRGRGVPAGRLVDPHAHQRGAVAVRQHRAVFAVPDACRAHRAGRRRRRRRQCGARLSRRQARRHRHLQEPRRIGRLRLHRLSRADPDHRRRRHRRSAWCSAR